MNTKLILNQNAYQKMKYFTQATSLEISGVGKSELILDKDGKVEKIVVTDVVIFKQECSGATTDLDEQSIAKFFLELTKKKEKAKDWNIWWHSHANMGVFWSTTDESTISNHIGLQPFLVSIVTNKKNEYEARLDIFPKDTSPFKKGSFIKQGLDVEIEEKEANEAIEKDKLEISDMIDKIEEKKEKANEHYDKILEQATEKLLELEEIDEGDPKIQKKCEKEVKEKVNEKKISNYHRGNNYDWRSKQIKNDKWDWLDEEPDELDDDFIEERHPNKLDDVFYTFENGKKKRKKRKRR